MDDDGKNGQEVNEKLHGVEENNLERFANTLDIVHNVEVVNRVEALNKAEVVNEVWIRVDYIRDGIHVKGGYLAN